MVRTPEGREWARHCSVRGLQQQSRSREVEAQGELVSDLGPGDIQIILGKRHLLAPANIAVVHDNIVTQDGTRYLAGYNFNHHPNGVPVFCLTLIRVSKKKGEEKSELRRATRRTKDL